MSNIFSIKELVWMTVIVDLLISLVIRVVYISYIRIPTLDECIILNKSYDMSILLSFVYMLLSISSIIVLVVSINNVIGDIIDICKGKPSRIISNVIVIILITVLTILLIYTCVRDSIEPCGVMLQVNSIVGLILLCALCLLFVLFTAYMINNIKDTFNKDVYVISTDNIQQI